MLITLEVIFSILVAFGLAMVFVPLLPAMFYMFIMSLLFAVITKFTVVTPKELLVLAIIVAASFAVDWSAGLIGARWGGASSRALLIGLVGLVAGFLLFPPFGGILGLFIGVLFAEIEGGQGVRAAIKAASASTIGAVSGIFINFILALAFLTFFLLFLFY